MIENLSPAEMAIIAIYSVLSVATIPFAVHAYIMVALRPRQRLTSDKGPVPDEWPTVTVQLPIYNERYVVRGLLEAICAFDYPADRLEVQVLDDSTDDTRDILSELVERYRSQGIDIVLLHRRERTGYKAGALKEGLEVAKGEFLAIFDADFLPPPDFLRRTIPAFKDDVGAVQTRWGHLNREYSPLTRVFAIAIDAAFVLESGVRHARGLLVPFNGTCGVWRKAALIDAGGWDADTLTEDIDLAVRAQLRHWRIEYLNDVVCEGELPATVAGIKTQQLRWATGVIQNARKHLKTVLREPRMSLLAKYEGSLLLCNHIIFPIVFLMCVLAWPVARLSEVPGPVGAFVSTWYTGWLVLWLGYPLYFLVAQKETYEDWPRRLSSLPLLLACLIGLSALGTLGVAVGLSNRKGPFMRTPKYRLVGREGTWRGRYRTRHALTTGIELFMAVYLAFSTWYAVSRGLLVWVPFLLLATVGFAVFGGVSVAQALAGGLGRDPSRDAGAASNSGATG
jgi:cellulose synthase/poly-beta-1,6-N-acetylglucosamine synthase-like glycosyltransferase